MPRKIFIADDSSTIRGVVESLLRQKGYEVYSAPDGESAISMIEKTRPDMILLDSSMPGQNGIDICRQLRQKNEFAQTPIIILAGSSDAGIITDFIDGGATDTIIKPFTPRELGETVEKFILDEENISRADSNGAPLSRESSLSRSGSDGGVLPWEQGAIVDGLQRMSLKDDENGASEELISTNELKEMQTDESDALDFTWSDLSLENGGSLDDGDKLKINLDSTADPKSISAQEDDEAISQFIDGNGLPNESEADSPHDFEWFMDEMRRETSKTGTQPAPSGADSVNSGNSLTQYQSSDAPEHDTDNTKSAKKFDDFLSAFREDIRDIQKPDDGLILDAGTAYSDNINQQSAEEVDAESDEVSSPPTNKVIAGGADNAIPDAAEQVDRFESETSSNLLDEQPPIRVPDSDNAYSTPKDYSNEFIVAFANRFAEKMAEAIAKELSSNINIQTIQNLLKDSLDQMNEQNRS